MVKQIGYGMMIKKRIFEIKRFYLCFMSVFLHCISVLKIAGEIDVYTELVNTDCVYLQNNIIFVLDIIIFNIYV